MLPVALGIIPLVFLFSRLASDEGWAAAGRVFGDPETWRATARTLGIATAVGGAAMALSLPLAWWTHASDLPFRRAFRVVLNLPLAIPSYVSGVVVLTALAPGGIISSHLPDSLRPDVYGPVGVFIALLFSFPLALLPVQAALHRVDPRLWESARSLGAGPWRAFFRVIFPEIRGALARGGLLVALYVVGDFGAVSLLRYPSLSFVIYVRYRSLFGRHEAIPLALLLAAVAILLVVALLRLGGRSRRALDTVGGARAWPRVELGRYRGLAFVVSSLVVVIGVIAPLGIVAYWFARGLARDTTGAWPWAETRHALLLGGAAAAITLAVGLLPVLITRFGSRASSPSTGDEGWGVKLVRATSHLGYALPGIVVALAFVAFSVRQLPALYQTVPLLLLAYTVRFVPLAMDAAEDALLAQPRSLYNAARSLGASPSRALRRVVLPAARAGLLAGGLVVFIAVIKELPITLLMRPTGLDTLATNVWTLTEDAFFAEASPAIFTLTLLAVLGLLLRPDREVQS